MKTFPIKEKKKKAKKTTGVLNIGRRFPGPARRTLNFATSYDEKDNQEGKGKEVTAQPESEEEEEEDYSEEQYPPADDKYKHLEERLSAMEIQKVLGLDFEELGLLSRIVIPPKFKAPVFAKYDRVSCAKMHLRSYVRKIQPYTVDRNLWIHFFQESLSGTHLDWFYQLVIKFSPAQNHELMS